MINDNHRKEQKSELKRALLRFSRDRLSVVGLVLVLVVVLVAIFAPVIVPYPQHVGNYIDFSQADAPPSWQHPFGTDEQGRDVLTRILYGSRVSLMLGVVVISMGAVIGVSLGLIAGYFGGIIELVIMRITEIFLAIPAICLALVVSAVLSPSLYVSMMAIGFRWWAGYCKLIYGETLSIKEEDFVEVARTLGFSRFHIIFKEILPNLTSVILVKSTLDVAYAILTGAALGFLGLGAQPPTPEWGTIISIGREHLPKVWWSSVFGGLAISVTVLGFNLLGDGLRDFFDVEIE